MRSWCDTQTLNTLEITKKPDSGSAQPGFLVRVKVWCMGVVYADRVGTRTRVLGWQWCSSLTSPDGVQGGKTSTWGLQVLRSHKYQGEFAFWTLFGLLSHTSPLSAMNLTIKMCLQNYLSTH